MAKATGSITLGGLPNQYTTITIGDGQSTAYSTVKFTVLTNRSSGGYSGIMLSGSAANGTHTVLGNASETVLLYQNGSPTSGRSFFYIYFPQNNTDEWKTEWASDGTKPIMLDIRDSSGNQVKVDFRNASSGFTANVSGTSYGRKNSAGDYSINVNSISMANIHDALKDILLAADGDGEIDLYNSHVKVESSRLKIMVADLGDTAQPMSIRLAASGSSSWTTTSETVFRVTSGTNNTTTIANVFTKDEVVYSVRGASDEASGALSANQFASYFMQVINNLPLQVTASVSGAVISLENEVDGSSGNVTITTSDSTNVTLSGMTGGSSSGGGTTVARTKLNAGQMKLHASGGLAATGSVGELSLDISGSMELITSAQAADLVAVYDNSAGKHRKITVENLIAAGVAGSDTQVQYNNGGVLGAAADLTFNDSTGDVTVGTSTGDAKLMFRDSNSYIYSDAANDLKVVATDVVVDAATLIDLQSDAVHFGENGDTDVVLTFNANTSDGVLSWMEDEDYFQFSDDIFMASGEKVQFGDTGEYISGDGTDLTVVSSGKVSIDATNALDLNSASGDIVFQDGGTDQLALDMDGTAGEVIMQLKVDSDDFVFKQYDGTEVFRVEDDGAFDIAGGAGSSGVTITAAGQLTADGRIIVDDATEATTTTDGSLQTDGGLSVAKSVVIGDDLDLLSNSAIFKVGSDQPFTLTHANASNTATVSANHRLAFGAAADYIAGDGSDLSVVSSGELNLEATTLDIDSANINLVSQATDVDLVDNNSSALSFDASGKAGILELDTTNSSEGVKMSGYLSVTGDLTVLGTTTTVSSSNLMIQDSIIGIGVSGSAGTPSNSGDRGLIFGRGTVGAQLPGFWYDGTNFNLAKSTTSAASGSFGSVGTYQDLKIGNLLPGADDTFDLGSTSLAWQDLHLEGDVLMTDAGKMETAAGDMTVSSAAADVVLDAAADVVIDAAGGNVEFKDAGTLQLTLDMDGTAGEQIIKLGVDSDDLVFKQYDGNEVIRITDDRKLKFYDDGDEYISSDGTDLTIDAGGDITIGTATTKIEWGSNSGEHIVGDGASGLQVASGAKITLDATTAVEINSAAGDIVFQDGGTDQLALDLDGTAGEVIMQLKVDSDDFVFKQYDGTEVFRVEDDGAFDIAGGAGSSGVTITAAGQLTADGRVIIDDATDATSTTDGSLQTDGGLSVAKDVIAGNDVKLLSDSSVLSLGAGSDATLTHDGTTGLTIAATPISINSTGDLTLDSSTDIVLDAAGGNIEFKDNGTLQMTLDMDTTGGAQILKLGVDSDDLVFQQYDGNEVVRIGDDRRLYFYDKGGEYISGNGTVLSIVAGTEIDLSATNIDINGATVFDDISNAAGNGLQHSAGTLSITWQRETFMSGSGATYQVTGGLTASLNATALSDSSVSVYLNGILQTVSGSAGTTYDYILESGDVKLQSALDSDDVLVIQYIKQ